MAEKNTSIGEDELAEARAVDSPKSTSKPKPGVGPIKGVSYPLTVLYCGECGLPVDLCEYSPNPEACKDWLEKTHPGFSTKLQDLQISESAGAEAGEDSADKASKSSHQKRGGKAMPKTKKERVPSKVLIMKNQRKGNKSVTIIRGLAANDIDLEVARKFFAQKFACSCSKGEVDELIIQGDVVDSLYDVIPEKFSQISRDLIEEKS